MEQPQIKSGPAEVLISGIVASFEGNPIEIKYSTTPDSEFVLLILAFENDASNPNPYVKSEILNNDKLKVTFYNIDSDIGTRTKKPIPIGEFSDESTIYIHMKVSGAKDSDKIVQYSLYKVKKDGI